MDILAVSTSLFLFSYIQLSLELLNFLCIQQ